MVTTRPPNTHVRKGLMMTRKEEKERGKRKRTDA
jgi:hypothetical protein